MKALFSSVVAITLLAIYVLLVWHAISVSDCAANPECIDLKKDDFTNNMASSLALIGGLVSALVIAELAITKTGEAPAARLVDPATSQSQKGLMQIVTGLYLIVWLATGLSAYVFGYLLQADETVTSLADLGQGWLGIAVGAGYAYFGIKQP